MRMLTVAAYIAGNGNQANCGREDSEKSSQWILSLLLLLKCAISHS
jgi:hypothetical protein